MIFIHRIAGAIVGGMTRPMASWPVWLTLVIHATLIALLALGCFALLSNQAVIRRAKNTLIARLLEIRLFKDDPWVVLGAFGRILSGTMVYLKSSLLPLLVMLPVMLLWVTQLAGWFEWRPLRTGETAIVKAVLNPGHDAGAQPATLETPPGFEVETPAFRSPESREILWRVRATGSSSGALRVRAAGGEAGMQIFSGNGPAPVAPRKPGAAGGFWDRVLHPQEQPLDAGSVFAEICIDYPVRSLRIAGLEVHWLVWLLLVSISLGFVLKRPLGVEF